MPINSPLLNNTQISEIICAATRMHGHLGMSLVKLVNSLAMSHLMGYL